MSFLAKTTDPQIVALRETGLRVEVFKKAASEILDEYDLDEGLQALQDMIRGLYAGPERGSTEPTEG